MSLLQRGWCGVCMVWRTEGADEVGHLPASPSSSHCGHFAPFLSPPNRSCCAYLQNIYIIHILNCFYLLFWSLANRRSDTMIFFANDSDYPDGSSSFKGNGIKVKQFNNSVQMIQTKPMGRVSVRSQPFVDPQKIFTYSDNNILNNIYVK